MFPRLSASRMLRLCLKELRESLRDRRTIVTLVLMPLLVYPLLSLVLNRVLLTSATKQAKASVSFGIGTELKDSSLPAVLVLGYAMIQDRESTPVFTEETVVPRKPGSGTPPMEPPVALPEPQLIVLQDSGRVALENGSVDLVITRKDADWNAEVPAEPSVAPSADQKGFENLLRQIASQENWGGGFDFNGVSQVVGNYQVRYRQGDAQSERALQILERTLAAVNNASSSRLIGLDYKAPFRLAATPVASKSDYSDLLATMVPLVLVLMTMAGAVYPAIDLTAGERERGTMEALIVSPTPSWALLLAKYSAVVTVALLTALANLAAMTVTLWVSGIGKMVFGDGVLNAGVIGTVLVLLVLFTMFFAALLLAVTSFAKSFKEAQAYLIPLMLLALTPGVMSLLPGIKFTNLLATVPLVNIVLLARQVLVGGAEWNTALVAVICNCLYALAALVLASRLFGSNASMHGSSGSWRDLMTRPQSSSRYPTIDQMALTMAVMFPLYFVASSSLSGISSQLSVRLWASAVVSFLLILALPVLIALLRRIEIGPTFRLQLGSWRQWAVWLPAVVLVAGSAWMMAHEIFIGAQMLGIGTISSDHFDLVADFRDQLQRLPLWMVLFVFAVTPAVCEEFLFRGFVLSSLHKYSAFWAVAISAVLFGLMHVLTSNVLAVERFLPTTFMGIILGVVAMRTGSILPGIVLHALHNGLLLTLSHFSDQLQAMNFLVEEGQHLPALWLVGGLLSLVGGIVMIWLSTRKPIGEELPSLVEPPSEALAAEL